MSNVIRFLEGLGQAPAISAQNYAAVIASLDVDTGERQALLDRDQAGLNDLLGGRAKMICMVATPDEG